MASRIALLILAIGSFAVLWSGDHADRIAAVDRPAKVLVGSSDRRSRIDAAGKAARENPVQVASSQPESTHQQMIAPLPHGITAGTYMVVNQYGRTYIQVVSREDSRSAGSSGGRRSQDHFAVESANILWHYIRIQLNDVGSDRLSITTVPTIR